MSFLFPPRPRRAITRALLHFYEERRWQAEVKKDGHLAVILSAPTGIDIRNRHGKPMQSWRPTLALAEHLRRLPGDGIYALVGEVMHARTRDIKDTVYLFDVMMADGRYLVGMPRHERRELLRALFKPQMRRRPDEYRSHICVDENLWLARAHDSGFEALFDALEAGEDEGLVIKDPHARLQRCGSLSANHCGQVKLRRAEA